jgi:hypothetical protein
MHRLSQSPLYSFFLSFTKGSRVGVEIKLKKGKFCEKNKMICPLKIYIEMPRQTPKQGTGKTQYNRFSFITLKERHTFDLEN